jgi:hypothetical protein
VEQPGGVRLGAVPAGRTQLAPDGLPIPRPMSTAWFTAPFVKVSTAVVKITVTVPPLCPTVKGWEKGIATLFTGAAMTPAYAVVKEFGDEGAVADVLEPLLQAAVVSAIPTATRMRRFMSLFS